MKAIALILLSCSFVANAEPCNKKEQNKTDSLVKEYPLDDYAVKLSAYRTGLCYYVKSNKISEDRAGQLLEIEKQKMMLEKLAVNQKPIT